MSGFISEDYENVIKMSSSIAEEYQLDSITFSSLVRGCVEIDKDEAAPVQVLWKDAKSNMHSFKLQNIRINFLYALNVINAASNIDISNKEKMVLSLLTLIVQIFYGADKIIDRECGKILISVYKKQHVSEDAILEEFKKDMDKDKITEYIKELTNDVKCIELVNGELQICEQILGSKFW